ncbi:MAG: hypothetical protein HC897_06510 [Thermoanaerobaculia bacterium]|nr:hypothetical protein [Thermoanaerobaculia bacterium]
MPGGVFGSGNGGKSWSTLLADTAFVEVWFDPGAPQRVLARSLDQKLYRSLDGGASWLEISPVPDEDVSSWVVDARSTSRLLAVTRTSLYRSEDFGTSWVPEPLPQVLGDTTFVKLLASAADGTVWAGFLVQLAVDGTARQGLYRSTDFGQTWSRRAAG